MSSVVISGDTSGSITLSAPAVSGTNTATLPAATGTVMVSGNMPAFSAYTNTAQVISATTWTKVAFNTESFDTANAFDSTTNYRFTPQVAGYYQINSIPTANGTTASFCRVAIYKNGVSYKVAPYTGVSTAYSMPISDIIQLNGSTDYLEIYVYLNLSDTINSSFSSWFSASLVRTA